MDGCEPRIEIIVGVRNGGWNGRGRVVVVVGVQGYRVGLGHRGNGIVQYKEQ